jgi:hypothetical protein
MKNRELFLVDPTTFTIPNEGVTKIYEPRTANQWAVLRYELSRFVCEGEYRRGLERVLTTYLTNLNNPEQPAVWVSGFYGSGKSHFVRVLEYLWQDIEFPDGASARSLAKLPTEINDQLRELTMAGRRAGGLWSAAGTLGASAGSNVRLALLAIAFRSIGLPDKYPLARFVLWLTQNGLYEAFSDGVKSRGKAVDRELANLYVSPVIADSLLDAYPEFASSSAEARSLLKAQYPNVDDISDDEFLTTLEYVLELQSDAPGKLPLTLLVFDELQQFLGEDAGKTLQVQTVVEACSARFGSRLLFVGTGQAALQATPQLSRLRDRFTVRVMLSDTDVDQVVREVVLRKAQDKVPILKSVLDTAHGEIDRHLGGTRIAPTAADNQVLVADYPLLPTRRRFWENTLRAIDPGGVEGQLRTQLRMVHEATRDVADKPVGTVVPADVIYDQQKSSMLQSGVLLPDLSAIIERQNDGTPEGELRSRLCATIFLIGKLPTEGAAATGLEAKANILADLLVQDLTAGSASLRQRIPALLQDLVESGTLMLIGDEYRLQTPDGAEWEGDYRKRYARIRADDSRIASDRTTELRNATAAALKGITLTQGTTKTPRKFDLYLGIDAPKADTGAVPVWVRDEWSVSEKTVREEAQAASTESPIVFVLLPRRESDALRDALASHAAAKECVDMKPVPATPEGMEARLAMQSRQQIERGQLGSIIGNIVNNGRVYQGGGNEVVEGSLADSVRAAVEAALIRLFPKFGMVDYDGWGKVVKRAQEGAADALTAVGHTGDVDKHPVCQEIRTYLGSAGKKGSEVRKHFTGVGYGWSQDSVDGALLALVAGGFVRATQNGQTKTAKQLIQSQIGVTTFHQEGVTVSAIQRIAVRKLMADLGLPCNPNEEAEAIPKALHRLADLAHGAGGPPPLPERPSTLKIEILRALGGNAQLVAVHDAREELRAAFSDWTKAGEKIVQRQPRWLILQQLLQDAATLPVAAQVAPQLSAIRSERSLLTEPDPVSPLIGQLTDELRAALQEAHGRFVDVYQREIKILEASQEWQAIGETDRQAILSSLGSIPSIQVSTEDALLRTLQASPLHTWADSTAALPTLFAQARMKAARLLEPKSVRVKPKPATLRSAEEVETYLEELRAEIMKSIDAGNPVILQG